MYNTSTTLIVKLSLLLLFCQNATAQDWQTIYEGDLTSGSVINDWIPIQGEWTMTSEGMKTSGAASEGLLMLRQPVVKSAVRIEYEAKADTLLDDLSLCLGIKGADSSGAAFFGFGSKDNTEHSVRVPGAPTTSTGKSSSAKVGQWHKVTALREGGRLTLEVDGCLWARCNCPNPAIRVPLFATCLVASIDGGRSWAKCNPCVFFNHPS